MKLAAALVFAAFASVGTRSEARERDAAPQPATVEHEPATRVSARLSVGAGGGSVGVAGRVGLQLEYWLSEHLGISAVGALPGQTSLSLFGAGTSSSYWFVGPALAARSHSSGTHALASAAVGYMDGTRTRYGEASFLCFEGDCDVEPPRRTQLRGIAAVLSAGFAAGDGPVQCSSVPAGRGSTTWMLTCIGSCVASRL